MTHRELVDVAARWLKASQRCGVVFREHYAFHEIPDALGYRGVYSVCVECKVSRADFVRDLKKRSRQSYDSRPARLCYYLSPEPLNGEVVVIPPARLPDGWGLLNVNAAGRVSLVRKARLADSRTDDRTHDQMRSELHRLYLDIRRYQAQGLFYEPLRKLTPQGRAARQNTRLADAVDPVEGIVEG